MKLKERQETGIRTLDDLVFAPINEEALKQHLAQIADAESLRKITLRQRKKHASEPIYLIRYE